MLLQENIQSIVAKAGLLKSKRVENFQKNDDFRYPGLRLHRVGDIIGGRKKSYPSECIRL